MPTKGWPPATSTAQSPQPSRAISSLKRSTSASLSARLGDSPSDSTTSGCAFSSAKGGRSTSVNGRKTRRSVTILGPVDPLTAPASSPWRP